MQAKALLSATGGEAVYVADVFSTYLYTGNGSTQTIINNIDLLNEGGLAFLMNRGGGVNWVWTDTVRGVNYISSNNTNQQLSGATFINAFNTNGFTGGANVNTLSANYASWTFRKQPKFFDVVTYTGDGVAGRTVSHSLGSVPGCIIVKRTDDAGNWYVYHVGANGGTNPQNYYLWLQSTNAQAANDVWNNQAPTSSVFYLGGAGKNTNEVGSTYVAYLFAHDAGGFGASGLNNVISCGSFTTDGSGNGSYTPNFTSTQWLMLKCSSNTSDWETYDTQRTPAWSGSDARLRPNLSAAEDLVTRLSASGSTLNFTNLLGSETYIIVAVAAP